MKVGLLSGEIGIGRPSWSGEPSRAEQVNEALSLVRRCSWLLYSCYVGLLGQQTASLWRCSWCFVVEVREVEQAGEDDGARNQGRSAVELRPEGECRGVTEWIGTWLGH